MLESLLYDLRFAAFRLRKSPGFTLAAVLTLALGIGANVTIFSWLNAVILNPLPGVDSKRLVSVRWRTPQGSQMSFSWPDYLDIRKRARNVSGLSAGTMAAVSLAEGTHPERIWGCLVSADFFRTMGVKPILGRDFRAEDDEGAGAHPVAVISHRLWQQKFAADAGVVGREIRLNNRSFTIVGVAPEEFQGSVLGLRFEIYLPVTMRDAVAGGSRVLAERGSHWLQGYARLAPGASERQVEAELTAISAQLARESSHPGEYARAELIPIWRDGGGQMLAPIVMLMMGVVGVVLLIACANVANLLLARGAVRQRELAIRLALGVTRVRLVRELLVENVLLALLGGIAALAVVPFAGAALMSFAPVSEFPVYVNVPTGGPVLGFALGISLAATLLFGLLPALRASRPNVMQTIRDESGASAGAQRAWLRNALVVAQVSLSMVLLVGAGLLLKSLGRASSADPGFDPRNVLVAAVDLLPNGYDAARGKVALQQMIDRIAALPRVEAVSTIRRVPLGLGGTSNSFVIPEGYVPAPREEVLAYTHIVGPGYFHAMRTAVLAGREFTAADATGARPVIAINETFARRYFSKVDPLGRRVRLYGGERVVAGVVRDSKVQSLDEKPEPAVYLPVMQEYASEASFLVRTSGNPAGLARAVEGAIHSVDPALPVFGQRPLELSIATAYFGQRMGGGLLGVFGALALVLAAIGLYGVLAYNVTQRAREVGIRVALGAARGDVLRLILGHGLRLAGVGIAIGLSIAAAVTRLMTRMLFGVSPLDMPVIAGVAALLAAVALAASLVPAWRATRIDPIVAIRYQ